MARRPTRRRCATTLPRVLPDYMVPQHFIAIDSIPLMPNGKVDRKKLGGLALTTKVGVAVEPPQGELEQALAAVWSEVLGVEQVGRDDDFLALGGHSLLALRLIAGIKRATGLSLPLSSMLAAPTVRAQAAFLSGEDMDAAGSFALPVRAEGSQPPIFLVNGYGGTVVPFKALATALGPDQPLYILETGLDSERHPHITTLEGLCRGHARGHAQDPAAGPVSPRRLLAGRQRRLGGRAPDPGRRRPAGPARAARLRCTRPSSPAGAVHAAACGW